MGRSPIPPALAEFAVPAPKTPDQLRAELQEAQAYLATALGRLEIPHGGRVEKWSVSRRPGDGALPGGLDIAVQVRFPGMPRPIVATVATGISPKDWTIGSVVAGQVRDAIAAQYGLATYSETPL